jgi:hypothetical protein
MYDGTGYGDSRLCCARILLSVLRTTLLHGAFPWLQPRNPVVLRAVERGRGPDPPGASVEVQSARPNEAPQVRGSRRAAAPGGSPRPSARPADARPAAGSGLVVDRSLPWLASSASPPGSFTRLQTWASERSTQLLNSYRTASSFRFVRQPLCYSAAAVAPRLSCARSHFSTSLNTRSRP